MAPDDRQIGHAHLFGRGFLDQRHPPEPLRVSWVRCRDLLQEAAVDLIDDLQVSRKHRLQQWHRPLLQRLRRERVIGVTHTRLRDLPGLLPGEGLSHRPGPASTPRPSEQGVCRSVEWRPWQRTPGSYRGAARNLRTMSRMAQATRKYSCTRRNSRPATTASEG